ncbi:hypothetical protein E4K65_31190 [Bradyrhizobium niftali]|uniref:Uncharacterized protein n=1 Tax=Bradyrhizobium niftali TaxID=2560055 RepID=A0A4Y9LJ73_9BRAD|nr:hypothetical protein E4K65_31190 [Bradyrhizobium niftali]
MAWRRRPAPPSSISSRAPSTCSGTGGWRSIAKPSFRHSRAVRSTEPGISRFRVWSFGPSRNDGNTV